jgi:hypothetical protein
MMKAAHRWADEFYSHDRFHDETHWNTAVNAYAAGWKARASAEDRPLTEEQEKKVRRAMELIGARNDHLSEAAREGNINAAWHMLAALSRIRKEGE